MSQVITSPDMYAFLGNLELSRHKFPIARGCLPQSVRCHPAANLAIELHPYGILGDITLRLFDVMAHHLGELNGFFAHVISS